MIYSLLNLVCNTINLSIWTCVAWVMTWFQKLCRSSKAENPWNRFQKSAFLKLLYLGVERSKLSSICCVWNYFKLYQWYKFQGLILFLWIFSNFQSLLKLQACFALFYLEQWLWTKIWMILDLNIGKVSSREF